jgi:hypothetical protein
VQSYREAFRADVAAVKRALDQSKAALVGGTGQPGRAQLSADLNAAVAAELAGLEDAVARRERDGAGTSSPLPSGALAQSRSEEIRALIAQFVRQEKQLLTGEIGASQRAGQLLLLANFGGTFLIITLAAMSVTMVRRSTAGLRAAHKALEETNASRRRLPRAPRSCERRTRKSSTLPILSATTCARPWSTSWASQASLG